MGLPELNPEVYGEVAWDFGDGRYIMNFYQDGADYVAHRLFWSENDKTNELLRQQFPDMTDISAWYVLTPDSTHLMAYGKLWPIRWLNKAEDAWKQGDVAIIPIGDGSETREVAVQYPNGCADTLHCTYTTTSYSYYHGKTTYHPQRCITLAREARRI